MPTIAPVLALGATKRDQPRLELEGGTLAVDPTQICYRGSVLCRGEIVAVAAAWEAHSVVVRVEARDSSRSVELIGCTPTQGALLFRYLLDWHQRVNRQLETPAVVTSADGREGIVVCVVGATADVWPLWIPLGLPGILLAWLIVGWQLAAAMFAAALLFSWCWASQMGKYASVVVTDNEVVVLPLHLLSRIPTGRPRAFQRPVKVSVFEIWGLALGGVALKSSTDAYVVRGGVESVAALRSLL